MSEKRKASDGSECDALPFYFQLSLRHTAAITAIRYQTFDTDKTIHYNISLAINLGYAWGIKYKNVGVQFLLITQTIDKHRNIHKSLT